MWRFFLVVLGLVVMVGAAEAHTAARGFVLLLPTTLIIVCGALAVLVSFIALWLLPARWFDGSPPDKPDRPFGRWASLVALLVFVVLLLAGWLGSHDPLANPLPLAIWTGWWVLLVVLHAVLGNLWRVINPFTGVLAFLAGKEGRSLPLQDSVAGLIALVLFAGFAWWQLVWVTPEDPEQLTRIVLFYAAGTLIAGLFFGHAWFTKADPFFQMFRWVGAAAPGFGAAKRWPGFGLLGLPQLNLWQMALAILFLGTLSFDGLANSFLWASLIGVNPLDFQGRGSVMTANTVGLFGFVLMLGFVIGLCVLLGWRWAGRPGSFAAHASAAVLSLIPIAIALHFAHFLTDILVNGQYLIFSFNDPFDTGAALLGFEHAHVTTSFLNTAQGVWSIYSAQGLAVLFGHVVAVVVAHAAVARHRLPRAQALRLELPLALLMVIYTGFSLWSLSTPTIG